MILSIDDIYYKRYDNKYFDLHSKIDDEFVEYVPIVDSDNPWVLCPYYPLKSLVLSYLLTKDFDRAYFGQLKSDNHYTYYGSRVYIVSSNKDKNSKNKLGKIFYDDKVELVNKKQIRINTDRPKKCYRYDFLVSRLYPDFFLYGEKFFKDDYLYYTLQ